MGHLNDIKMSYFSHLIGALGYAVESFTASIIFIFHGFFPDCCVYTGSTIIDNLNRKIKNHANQNRN
jgi:hypothetical protein